MTQTLFQILGVVVITSPPLLLAALGAPMLAGWNLPETVQSRLMKGAVGTGLVAATTVLVMMLATGARQVPIELGDWVSIHDIHFQFHLKFVFDRLSVPFLIESLALCGIVGAFASVYLHRDPGYERFFLLYAIFLTGMVTSSLAGTIETLFFGWELVGLSSALLVAYFHERPGPVRNGHRIWTIYRFSDASFLMAALTLHHLTGSGDFDRLMGSGAWPQGISTLASGQAFLIGALLLLAAAGKSGMVPFSGWLPRAMEGPTPSSAVFYGALSVHLGTYLLLRVSPLLDASVMLQACVIVLGLASAVFGALAARVQNDVKNALAFASLTQVGIITVEIGCGLRYLPLIHMIGHACLRTLQLLRAPSVLRDHQMLENAVGEHLTGDEVATSRPATRFQVALYRWALHRGYLDAMLDDWIVRPFVRLFHWCDSVECRWTRFLSGEPSRQSDHMTPTRESSKDAA